MQQRFAPVQTAVEFARARAAEQELAIVEHRRLESQRAALVRQHQRATQSTAQHIDRSSSSDDSTFAATAAELELLRRRIRELEAVHQIVSAGRVVCQCFHSDTS